MTNYLHYLWINGDKANVVLNGKVIGSVKYHKGEWGFFPKKGAARMFDSPQDAMKFVSRTGKELRNPQVYLTNIKVAEVDMTEISHDTMSFISGLHVLTDRILRNDIYDIERIMDDISGTEKHERPQQHVIDELKAIKKKMGSVTKFLRIIKTK